MRSVLSRLPIGPGAIPPELSGLAARIRVSSPKVDLREVVRAYQYAEAAHEGQYRKSGEAYITHPVAVATKLADLGLDTATICAALLHDAVEDTDVGVDDVVEHFGEEVARLVDGVTKLDRLEVSSKQHQQAETLRKMILAMAEDIRVLVIKLSDRLHNMETLGSMPREKQKRIAQETLDIYAPLAHRLGMQNFKLRLEDLGFATLHPKRYEEIVAMVEERTPERDAYIKRVVDDLDQRCREVRVRADITGRPKHHYSIYEKMVLRGKEFDEIHDLIGLRVLVDTVRDCYAVLGQVHATWRPIPGRFKDYIAMPKFNFYQSLHTSVIGPDGRPLEIQIRTYEMHHTAEYGVAAHWKYKDDARGGAGTHATQFDWVQRLAEWQQDTDLDDPSEYLDALKIDLYQDEVFVFTPNGDVVALPKNATPIDFAYTIHTDVGHRCVGARVNGRLVPLDHKLTNGVTVEIMTSKADDAGPSRDWLKIAASQRARSKIRAWFNKERREDALERGRESVSRALRQNGLSLGRVASSGELAEVAGELSYTSVDGLMRAVGEGHVTGPAVARAIVNRVVDEDVGPENLLESVRQAPIRIRTGTGSGVAIDGDTDMMVTLASCCTPVPGDQIAGFITRGRGVSVHRRDCPNMADLARQQPERILAVDWTGERASQAYEVTTQVEAFDRHHLLRDITSVLGDLRVSITSAQVTTRRDRVAVLRFSFEMGDPEHLDYLLRSIRSIDGVYDAYRVTPGSGGGDEAAVAAAVESASRHREAQEE